MSSISMIVAMGKDRTIGKDNKLIWDIPEDLKYFKERTLGKTIVMGRKTFESIGRPLPGRRNVVMTRDPSFKSPNIDIVNHVDEVLAMAYTGEDIVVIGGDSVYQQFLPHADTLYITEIDEVFEGDTFFPEISVEWELVESTEGLRSHEGSYKYFFNKYEK